MRRKTRPSGDEGLEGSAFARAGHRSRMGAAPAAMARKGAHPAATEWGKDCAWTIGSSRVSRIAAFTSGLGFGSTA